MIREIKFSGFYEIFVHFQWLNRLHFLEMKSTECTKFPELRKFSLDFPGIAGQMLSGIKSSIQVCRPQCRVTINCKIFTMASIVGIYQLLMISDVLASGRDLVTPSRGSSESTGHQWRVKAGDPTLATDLPPLIDWRRLPRLMTSWEGQSNC